MRIINTPAYRRHVRCRHALVLALYLQKGTFWEHVSQLRSKWGITAERRVPPDLLPAPRDMVRPWESSDALHYPSCWPARPFDWLINETLEAPSDPMDREVYERMWRFSWWEDVSAVATIDVPTDCQGDDQFRADAFVPFVATCALYDPPANLLLDFSKAAPLVVAFSPISHSDRVSGKVQPAAPVAMFQPPIVARQDAKAVATKVIDHYEALLSALTNALQSKGINLRKVRVEICAEDRSLSHAHLIGELRLVPNEHFIRVRPETTKEEVEGAFDLIRARYPGPKRQKDRRTDLECVQVALWREAGQSEEQIAQHFGWSVSRADAEMPRCKNVRDYAHRGREILRLRSTAV